MFITSIFCFITLFIIYHSSFFEINGISKRFILFTYLTKLLFAVLLYYVYTNYYTDLSKNDIYKYYNDSKVLVDLFYHSSKEFCSFFVGKHSEVIEAKLVYWKKTNSYGFFNDNRTLILIQTLIGILSNKSLGVSFILFTFISFTSIIALIKCFDTLKMTISFFSFSLFFFVPSVLFWSSGPTKETLILSSINGVIFQFISFFSSKKTIHLALGSFFLICLLISKNIIFILLGITGGVIFLWILFPKINQYLGSLFYITFLFFLIFIIDLSRPALKGIDFEKTTNDQTGSIEQKKLSKAYQLQVTGQQINILNTLSFKQRDYLLESKVEKANSTIAIKKINGSFLNFLNAIPISIWNVLFFPNCPSLLLGFKAIYYFENCLLITILSISIYGYNSTNTNLNKKTALFLLLFTFLVFVFQGMVTPVLGNLFRYKSVVMPVFFFAIILSSNAKLFYVNSNKS